MFSVNVPTTQKQYPQWNTRGRKKKKDEEGNLVQGEHSFGGEIVRVSPRFQKNGNNFRVRPERPAAFFAAYCYENGLLPERLTAEEAESDWGMELLEPLWQENQGQFIKPES